MEHVDVLIVGAGLSGIGAGVHLQRECPGKRYAILEARDAIGGTWDLFRYPGIRSDSDMYTLGYDFKPWRDGKAIADGPAILSYIRQTAKDHGIESKIRFQHRVVRSEWSSADAKWTVTVACGPDHVTKTLSCSFLYMCAGYYNYAQGYLPDFEGVEHFKGRLVHPQKWDASIEYAGKRVVVIGSGATAVTLGPAMADTAAHVTMLQRTPSYVLSLPSQDVIANFLRRILPARTAYALTRWKNVFMAWLIFTLSRHAPGFVRKLLHMGARAELGRDYDLRHFTPPYKPWDQRLCMIPDADLFRAIRKGRVTMVTDEIERFTEGGIKLKSGRELQADLVIAATGLELQLVGGATFVVDGVEVDPPKTMVYKGMMLSDVPNFAFAVGYTNASWTLKCDLVTRYVCRLIGHMQASSLRYCVPRTRGAEVGAPIIDFSSSYIQRALDNLPKQGARTPWKLYQNYALDLVTLRYGSVEDAYMEFAGVAAVTPEAARAA